MGKDPGDKGKRFKGKHDFKADYCSIQNFCLFIKISIAINLSKGKSLYSLLFIQQTGFH